MEPMDFVGKSEEDASLPKATMTKVIKDMLLPPDGSGPKIDDKVSMTKVELLVPSLAVGLDMLENVGSYDDGSKVNLPLLDSEINISMSFGDEGSQDVEIDALTAEIGDVRFKNILREANGMADHIAKAGVLRNEMFMA
ncbi:hypothetical protein REPUB_Repub03eG0092500 [Reevesia pubescens]